MKRLLGWLDRMLARLFTPTPPAGLPRPITTRLQSSDPLLADARARIARIQAILRRHESQP